VDQEEVNVVRAKCLEGGIEGFACVVRQMEAVIELACQVDLAAI
jgi:hypothetical protein